jgi:hypothetical protein
MGIVVSNNINLRNMKKAILLIFILTIALITRTQIDNKNIINIITTASFSEEDKKDFNKIFYETYMNDRSVKKSFEIRVSSFLQGDNSLPIKISNENSIQSFENFVNDKFKTKDELSQWIKKQYIDNYNLINQVYYVRGQLDVDKKYLTNIDDVFKWIKKNRKKDIYLIWNNGFDLYKYSSEFIKGQIINSSDVSKLKPKIVKPNSEKNVLRPEDSGYKIEFESSDLFKNYLIRIYKRDTIITDKTVVIFEKCINSLPKDSDTLKKYKFDNNFGLYNDFDKTYVFWISDEFLSSKCEQVQTTGEIIEIDPTCNCKFTCLYSHQYDLEIKGCSEGVPDSIIPASKIKNIEFQCNKTKNQQN